ncbi:hypothetical protein FGG08_002300 [Glutinoglossum americanum]|uniref:Uncharacterized protein n=1 Tax=Glutinoglossum americanum TaxID=1670608 RepID=A0A9P8I9I3_9PEZI|nr:hypothetical protein FGG08_002300 [Glutinoglossum americanum]
MSNNNALPSSLVETIAGLTAGVVTTLVVHPLDIIKTRLQGKYRFPLPQIPPQDALAVSRNEGSIGAFYRGLTPNLVGNSVSWGLYFLWYGKIKEGLAEHYGSQGALSSLDYLLASGTAGTLTAIYTNPIWVIKTRMLSSGRSAPGAYQSLTDGIRQIIETEGLKGFYRGLIPSVLGISHGAFQFMFYEQLKNHRRQALNSPHRHNAATTATDPSAATIPLSNSDYLYLSGLSKISAGSVTYPFQVVRARLQTYDAGRTYASARDAVMQIWRQEGFLGFYKG